MHLSPLLLETLPENGRKLGLRSPIELITQNFSFLYQTSSYIRYKLYFIKDTKRKNKAMNIPLVIDVDGTLFNGDFSHELLLLGITKSPLNAYNFIKQGLASKPQLKAKLADMLGPDLDISNLPYNETVIKYAKQYKANGGDVVLCSGSDNSIIQRIVMHFDWIDVGYGSTKERNLTNTVKRDFLKQLYPDGYAYIGNSKQDYSVWEGADKALAIAPPFGVKHIRTRNGEAVDILEPKSNSVSAALKSMRLHQWAKNALIFLVPALTIEELTYVDISNLLFGFLVMGFLASGTYIFNDLIDIQNDRQHANKKKRPFAKGTLNIPKGLALMIGCLFLALAATIFLPKFFAITLCAYFFITISYSVFLKRVPIVDVLTLALLFTIRVIRQRL